MITGLKSTMKEVADIREMLPRQPTAADVALAESMARFSPREICRMGSILTRMDRDVAPTVEEVAFMTTMDARPTRPLSSTDPTKPVCQYCHKQPAHKRELSFGVCCDDCFTATGGHYDPNSLSRDANGNYLVGCITR